MYCGAQIVQTDAVNVLPIFGFSCAAEDVGRSPMPGWSCPSTCGAGIQAGLWLQAISPLPCVKSNPCSLPGSSNALSLFPAEKAAQHSKPHPHPCRAVAPGDLPSLELQHGGCMAVLVRCGRKRQPDPEKGVNAAFPGSSWDGRPAPGVTLSGAAPYCLLPSAFAVNNHVLLQTSM